MPELALNGGAPVSESLIRICEPRFGRQVLDDIEMLLRSGQLREGTVTRRFEECFRKRVEAEYSFAVSSGTAALHTALASCVEPGSKVAVPAFSFFSTASTVIHAGCRPVFVDVDPDTFLIDVDAFREEVDAVVPVHLFGNVVDPLSLEELTDEGLKVVNDCAQSLGSTCRGVEVGAFPGVSCFSFYPTKIITTGEGGMVTANDEEFYRKGVLLKSHGEESKYLHRLLGYNYRSTEMASVLGLYQLHRIDEYLERRRNIAKYYDLAVGNIENITPQKQTPETDSCYNYYTVKMSPEDFTCTRDKLVEALRAENIETSVHYPRALTQQPALMPYVDEVCPVAEALAGQVFSLPVHPFLTLGDAELVVEALRKVVSYYLC